MDETFEYAVTGARDQHSEWQKPCSAFRAITDVNSAQGKYALALFDSTLA
jgi:hypothetical protein